MKLEELYLTLQERYPVEQEKNAAAEKVFKEELKKEILAIIHYAERAIDNNSEKVYRAYEKAREGQEDSINKPVYISFEINEVYVKFYMHVGNNSVFINQLLLNYDIGIHLNDLLRKSYCYDTSGSSFAKENSVQFNSYLEFCLNKSKIKLKFSAKPSRTGAFKVEERTIIKKFISDIKEIFPNSEEIPEPSSYKADLTVTLKCFGTEISNLGQSAQNSESASDTEENDLIDEQKLLAMSIDELNFSTRAHNVATRNDIFTIGDLVQLSESEFKCLKNVGTKTFKEIQQKLQEIGLTMKP